MLYADDDIRHCYHQSPALLQVVCQIFETAMAKRGEQVMVIDMDLDEHGGFSAYLEAREAQPHDLAEAIEETNRAFMRSDQESTVRAIGIEDALIVVRVTTSSDFAQPH